MASEFSKISVLVPTRNRVLQLQKMITSFAEMTRDPESAELVLRIDCDDTWTRDCLTELSGCGVRVLVGKQYDGYRSLPLFFNELREAASGDVFLCGNDDMVFRTPDWSTLVLAEANKYPDGLFDLGVCTLNAGVFPFSIISRHAVDLIGFIHDERLMWGDLFLRDVMRAFGRAIPLPSVRIDHEWMGLHPDDVFLKGDQGNPQYHDVAYWQLHRRCVDEAVARLDADHRQGPQVT